MNDPSDFSSPVFVSGSMEVRFVDNEVAIYATRNGLLDLARLCKALASRPKNKDGTDHLHMEDQGLLTDNSLKMAIAYFDDY